MLFSIFELLTRLIRLYSFVVIAYCVFSMAAGFGLLDPRNRIVYQIGMVLARLTEPVLNPIRRILPDLGSLDLSPFVLLLGLQYLVVPALWQIFLLLARGHA